MIAVVFFFACILAIGGGYAAITGTDMILNERGWTQVIAGSVVGTGGMILFGIGTLLLALRRLEQRGFSTTLPRDDESRAAPDIREPEPAPDLSGPLPAALQAAPPDSIQSARVDTPQSDQKTPAPAPVTPEPPREVVGTYAAGGITYFMYSDSSIEAEMEIGRYRFADMDDLRGFIETGKGGEKLSSEKEDRKPV